MIIVSDAAGLAVDVNVAGAETSLFIRRENACFVRLQEIKYINPVSSHLTNRSPYTMG